MAESSLSLTLADFAAAAGHYLGYGRTATSWQGWDILKPYVPKAVTVGSNTVGAEDTQLGHIMFCVEGGYRRFLTPQLVDEGPVAYQWSFLSPIRTMTIVAGQSIYDMPDSFQDLVGEMTYQSTDSTTLTIEEKGIGLINRSNQQLFGATAKPEICAIVPKATDGLIGQRWQIAFAPIPDATYTLTYQSRVLPEKLSATAPVPYGGMVHGETIIEGILAFAEENFQDEATVHRDAFVERLRASIAADRELRPDTYGYNDDRSDDRDRGAWQPMQLSGVTYKGVSF